MLSASGKLFTVKGIGAVVDTGMCKQLRDCGP